MEGCEQDLTSDPRRAVKNGEKIINTLSLAFPDVIDVLYSARNVQRKLLILFFLIILGNHICDVGCLVDNHIQTISGYENLRVCVSTCPRRPENGCGRPEIDVWSSS